MVLATKAEVELTQREELEPKLEVSPAGFLPEPSTHQAIRLPRFPPETTGKDLAMVVTVGSWTFSCVNGLADCVDRFNLNDVHKKQLKFR